jgi:hypothetical protein
VLVAVLRLKCSPFHWDFKVRYTYHELSPRTARRLEHLYFVKDDADLQRKCDGASLCLRKLLSEIGKNDVSGTMMPAGIGKCTGAA